MKSEFNNILIENPELNNNIIVEPNPLNENSLNASLTKNLSLKEPTTTKKIILSFFTAFIFFSLLFFLYINKLPNINLLNNKYISLASTDKKSKNYIELKFNCKDPTIPVQLFNSSNDI
jgi:hypothetical protein